MQGHTAGIRRLCALHSSSINIPMVLQLHVWGPAFGLPSIDADCLAAIAYLRRVLPRDEWVLVPTSEPARLPLGQLPALKHRDTWITGFDDIVNYFGALDESSSSDYALSPVQQAHCTAYRSFIQSRGKPLLDASLYVSSENYSSATRPALGRLLNWPNSWFIPHRLQDHAKKTSAHLGLNAFDLHSTQEEAQEKGLSAQIPQSLRKPNHTLTTMLGSDVRKSKFRLDVVTSDFFEPLERLLGDQNYLLGEDSSSLDCLAVAYLALIQAQESMPQRWLHDALSKRYPHLDEWTTNQKVEAFGDTVSRATESKDDLIYDDLPWRPAERSTSTELVQTIALNITNAVPWLATLLDGNLTIDTAQYGETRAEVKFKQKQMAMSRFRAQQVRYSQILVSSLTTAVIGGALFYKGLLRFPGLRSSAKMPPRFGDAGTMLGLG
jgi:sorting and assembly machinery component 37